MVNNNEKIQNLLQIKTDISPLMKKYLANLKIRYEWSQEARTEYFEIKRNVNSVAHDLLKLAKKEARRTKEADDLLTQVHEAATALLEEKVSQLGKEELKELTAVSSAEFTAEYAKRMHVSIKKHVNVSKRRLLHLLKRRINAKPVDQEKMKSAERFAFQLRQLSSDHMSKSYKEFSSAEFMKDLKSILDGMKSYSFDKQVSQLKNIQIGEWKEPPYPDSEEIIEKLHEIRLPSMYVKRGYTILEYVRPVYKNMNYFQRALREGREYIGTKNAYQRLMEALDDLETYYKSHYVQAGGKPKNYHGHYAGEKP